MKTFCSIFTFFVSAVIIAALLLAVEYLSHSGPEWLLAPPDQPRTGLVGASIFGVIITIVSCIFTLIRINE